MRRKSVDAKVGKDQWRVQKEKKKKKAKEKSKKQEGEKKGGRYRGPASRNSLVSLVKRRERRKKLR